MYASLVPLPIDMSSIAPMERYALLFFYLQGGGLYIVGNATMTNTNVYSNEAKYVCWPSLPIDVSSIAPMVAPLN